MAKKNTSHDEKSTLSTWFEKIQKWFGIAVSALGGLGLTVSSALNWLEDHPSLKIGVQLAFIALIPIALIGQYFYMRSAKKKNGNKISWGPQAIEAQYPKWAMTLVALSAVVFAVGGFTWGYQIFKESQSTKAKIIVLIAKFDGKKEDEERVRTHIFMAVKEATKDFPEVEVRSLEEVITAEDGSEKAREKGKNRNAKLVLWGWYDNGLNGSIYIEPLLSPDLSKVLNTAQRKFITEPEKPSIIIKRQLSGELSYVTLFVLGLLRIEARDYDEAINSFDQALKYPIIKDVVEPSDVYLYRAMAFYFKDKLDAAIADLTQVMQIKPDEAYAYCNRGLIYLDKGLIDKAFADYNDAIRLKPDIAEAYLNRGFINLAKQRFDEALSDEDKAIKLNPNIAEAYNNRGLAYKSKGIFDKAIDDFTQAVKIDPDDAVSYTNRSLAFHDLGKFNEALADANKSVGLNPNLAEAYNNRGLAYTAVKEFDKAIIEFNQAIKLKADYAKPYYNRGTTYKQLGKLDLALADFDKTIQLEPEYTFAYGNRGNTYALIDQFDKALGDYDKAIKLSPNYFLNYINRALLYMRMNNKQNAIADLRKSLELTSDPDARAYILEILNGFGAAKK